MTNDEVHESLTEKEIQVGLAEFLCYFSLR